MAGWVGQREVRFAAASVAPREDAAARRPVRCGLGWVVLRRKMRVRPRDIRLSAIAANPLSQSALSWRPERGDCSFICVKLSHRHVGKCTAGVRNSLSGWWSRECESTRMLLSVLRNTNAKRGSKRVAVSRGQAY